MYRLPILRLRFVVVFNDERIRERVVEDLTGELLGLGASTEAAVALVEHLVCRLVSHVDRHSADVEHHVAVVDKILECDPIASLLQLVGERSGELPAISEKIGLSKSLGSGSMVV